ncbi:2-hydroxy-3-oxopropionate reductase [Bacillus sp. V3-13]|uniref:NAD(P)-dependent oxidoreductase n=1 Tax=Bacillus sp. V3-13 TaxID=2053728 RepID=UPI000C7838AF|nr:NAD(P)-dependent oxidoreductase [Bacillus sp. V3-13]PLR75898.1 2-hydroxy-3-oxopropionate reductase [Bacillus sp. V3-13]
MNEYIGFIGLGKMGLPMAVNLLKRGYTVYGSDIDHTALKEFISLGGRTGRISDWIKEINCLILMLPSSAIVDRVIDEVLEAADSAGILHPSLTIIDMGSSYPSSTKENGIKLKEHHIGFLDAPVSGGVKKAITAELTIMVGGEQDSFTNCKRLLNAMGANLFYVGPLGSGHLMKAVNNYLSASHLLTSCEAVQLLSSYGVNEETAINVFNQSTGRSGSTEYKFPAFILNERFNSGFSIELMTKDLEMAKDLFLELGADTSLPQSVFNRFNEASQLLEEEADHTEIYKYVSRYLLTRGNNDEEREKIISDSPDSAFNI